MIKEALDALAGKMRLAGDRSKTVGASEVGQCMRKICATKKNGAWDADPEYANRWGAQVRGSTFEKAFWEPALRAKYGSNLIASGADQVTLADGYLSATPDGWVTGLPRGALKYLGVLDIGPSRTVVLECKTVDPRVGLKQAKAENVFQVQVQMGLICSQTEYKPDWCVITYADASFWDDVSEFAVQRNPKVLEVARGRAAQIMTSQPGELPPEGWIAGGAECKWCPYAKPCGVARRSVPDRDEEADPQLRAEIEDMVRGYVKVLARAAETDAEVRKAQQEIKDRLKEKGISKIPGLVSWTAVKGRTNYDMPALREAAAEAGVDVDKFCTAGDPSDRLSILLEPEQEEKRKWQDPRRRKKQQR